MHGGAKMADKINQKLKILYIRDYLMKNSNEDNPISVAQLIAYLASNGIPVERKTIYDDIAQLQYFGDDILLRKGKNGGYFFASRQFELPEIKMLVDSVQSSKFLTEKQSMELIKKLETLTDKYDAGELQRQVVVKNRVKTEQSNIFSSIDHINSAINGNKTVKFKYFRYNVHKEQEFRYGGKIYEVSPFCLIWEDENYYLLAYDNENGIMKHYRVDRMKNVASTDNPRQGHDLFDQIDISSYNKKVFSMYHGDEKTVKLRFTNELVNVVIDRFGKETIIVPEDDGEHFTVSVSVVVSNQFFGWLFGLADGCEVVSPADVREKMRETAEAVIKQYK